MKAKTRVENPKETIVKTDVQQMQQWQELYLLIKGLAKGRQFNNTIIALSIAIKYHAGQTRKTGEPYIIHPLMVTLYLINLGLYDDILLAASILHDICEDTYFKDHPQELVTVYGLDTEVLRIVLLLTKDPNYKQTDPTEEQYYARIFKDIRATLIKLSDRTNNVSTIDAFRREKMIQYMDETRCLVYPLCKNKELYPQYADAITIIKYLIVSICEVTSAILGISCGKIDPLKYKKTFKFVEGYALGQNMNNTLIALYLSERLHQGQLRKSGDPFITHPLRVCSYLLALKVGNDEICAAALLHEVFKKCGIPRDSMDLVEKYHLSQGVVDLIHLVSKPDEMTKEEYYEALKGNPYAILLKLSNRANTCTILYSCNQKEIDEYVSETEKFIYPLCQYGISYYPQFSGQIKNMEYHISSVCRLVHSLTHEPKTS